MLLSAVALLSALLAVPAEPAPVPPTGGAPGSLSPAVSDADVAEWVAESLIRDVRGRPESADEWLARKGRVDDLALAREVSARLAAAGLSGLVVACSEGQVSLRGRSPSEARREAASAAAAAVPGVRGVTNALRLPGEPVAAPAAAPAPAPAAAPATGGAPASTDAFDFLTADGLAGRGIVVDVTGGVVTLSGLVNNDDARLYAMGAAYRIPGVRSVFNTLAVRPHNSIEDRGTALLVQRRLEDSVLLKPVVAAITVCVVDGVLQLRGGVRTEAQRQEAERLALDTSVVFAVSSALVVNSGLLVPEEPRVRDFRLWTPY